MKKYGQQGITLVEMLVVIGMFSLFMLAVYATVDAGMKGWQMGETKSDLQQKTITAMGRITTDFRSSTWFSTKIDHEGEQAQLNEYICFESPFKSDGHIDKDMNSKGSPVWQGYVFYYIYPRWAKDSSSIERTLYRHYKPISTPGSIPFIPDDAMIMNGIDIISPPSGDAIRTVMKDIYSIDLDQKETGLIITISARKNILKDSMVTHNYSGAIDKNRDHYEIFELKGSVVPQN